MNYKFLLPLTLLFFYLPGCETTTPDGKVINDDPEQNIEFLIQITRIAKDSKYMETCLKIVEEYGEKALPKLQKNLSNKYPKIRIACLYCIGEIYERTKSKKALELRPQISRLLRDKLQRIRLEAASTLCTMGDYQGVPLLIQALRSDNAYVRCAALHVLFHTFEVDFGYDHQDKPEVRELRVRVWEEWWLKNKRQYLRS